MKRAQELSITTIVIAALAVLVLVVLAVVFAGRIGIFAKEITVSCASQGGLCKADCGTDFVVGHTPDAKPITCPDTTLKCCMNTEIAQQRGYKV